MRIVVVVRAPDGREAMLPELTPQTPPASLSSDEPTMRRMYLIGWVNGEPGVYESTLGVDIEVDATHRMVHAAQSKKLTDLTEPYELNVWRRGVPIPMVVTMHDNGTHEDRGRH